MIDEVCPGAIGLSSGLPASTGVPAVDTGPAGDLWGDDFERADTTGGLAAVGAGWAAWGGAVANISDGALVNESSSGSYRVIYNPAGGELPADHIVEITVPHSVVTGQSWWGIVGRYDHTVPSGVRVLFTSGSTTFVFGNASGPWDGESASTTDAGFPASWAVDQDHTVALSMSGTTVSLICDGQTVAHATVTVNSESVGSECGICGDNTMTVLGIRAVAGE